MSSDFHEETGPCEKRAKQLQGNIWIGTSDTICNNLTKLFSQRDGSRINCASRTHQKRKPYCNRNWLRYAMEIYLMITKVLLSKARKSSFLLSLASLSNTASGFGTWARWSCICANPESSSSPIMFRRYVFKRLRQLNGRSAGAVVKGKVANISSKVWMFG